MKYNYKLMEEQIENLIKERGEIPKTCEITAYNDFIPKDMKQINKYYKEKYGKKCLEYYNDLGFSSKTYKKKLTYNELVEKIRMFISKNGRFPKSYDFRIENGLISYGATVNLLNKNNKTLNEIAREMGFSRHSKTEGYAYWLNKLKEVIENNNDGEPLFYYDFKKYDLPDIRWYIDKCGNDKVVTINDFIRYELHLIPIYNADKEDVVKIINKMKNKLNRPLLYDDFLCNNTQNTVCASTITRLWGSMNEMKKELGLEIVQESMVEKHKSKEEMLEDMQRLIDELGRIPSADDIDNCSYTNNTTAYYRYFKGINNALILLGYKPNKKCIASKMNDDEIKEVYKDFIIESGYVPSYNLCKSIYELPSPITVTRRFNCTWNDFIKNLGFEPNNCVYNPMFAKDGTRCNSTREAFIHNYLLDLNVDFEKEVLYSDILFDEKLKEQCGVKRLDWVIHMQNKDYYIEYFGLMGKYDYNKRHDLKIAWLKRDNKLNNFIAIYPEDLNKLDKLIKEKIKYEEEC